MGEQARLCDDQGGLVVLGARGRGTSVSSHFNIKSLKQASARVSVLAAEPKGQEIITGKAFLAKVTLIENYINHLEEKKCISTDAICPWDNIHFRF